MKEIFNQAVSFLSCIAGDHSESLMAAAVQHVIAVYASAFTSKMELRRELFSRCFDLMPTGESWQVELLTTLAVAVVRSEK